MFNGQSQEKLDPIDGLASLSGQLTDPRDRESYASLVTYFRSLPEGDDLLKISQLLGFLTLLGQRVPEAIADFLEASRKQADTATEYYERITQRLASLPDEISEGVDVAALAHSMSEAFRQQLVSSGLNDIAALLKTQASELSAVTTQLGGVVKPLKEEYRILGAKISSDLATLNVASLELQSRSTTAIDQCQSRVDSLADQSRREWRLRNVAQFLAVLLAGIAVGTWLEVRQTAKSLHFVATTVQQIQACQALPSKLPVREERSRTKNRSH